MTENEDPRARDVAETARIRAIYERTAARYDRTSGDGGRVIGDGRAWLASEARGDTLEVGVGTGRTLRWYPDTVTLTGTKKKRRKRKNNTSGLWCPAQSAGFFFLWGAESALTPDRRHSRDGRRPAG